MADELQYSIQPREDGWRVDRVCHQRLRISRTLLRRLKLEGGIRVNGQVVHTPHLVSEGDVLELAIGREVGSRITPEQLPLEIIYEDADLAVVNKPVGMLTHPTPGCHSGTVVNALAGRWTCGSPRPVNRLDRDTSGVLVVARSQWAHGQLARQLHSPRFERIYLAVVAGEWKPEMGQIEAPIGRDPDDIRRNRIDPLGKAALTHYRVSERLATGTVLELRLETGRTHQIRVHLSAEGFPLLGDSLYGGDNSQIDHQALHALRVRFQQPRTKELMEWTAPLPTDLRELLQQLRVSQHP